MPDALDTFAEPNALLASATIPSIWPVESWFDEVPAPRGVLPESPYCAIEVWR